MHLNNADRGRKSFPSAPRSQQQLLECMGFTMLHSRGDRDENVAEARVDREEFLAELRTLLASRSRNLSGVLQALSKAYAAILASASHDDAHFNAGVRMACDCLLLDSAEAYAERLRSAG